MIPKNKAPMKQLLYVLAFVAMTVSGFTQNSQNKLNLTEGTRYMVAFPQVWASPSEKPLPQPMQLFISSKVKTKVRVQTPAGINDNPRMDREYSVEANKVLKISVSTIYMNVNSQTKAGYGILVTSKAPISVSTYQAWMGNGELARHLPIESWGKNYYTANMYQDRYGQNGDYKYRPSQILLIAGRDNTVVTYTPVWATEGGNDNPGALKGQSQTITLDKGETYLIKGKIDENFNKEWVTDLSGTLIRSNKPVGVISGHTKVAILRYPDVLPPSGIFATEAHFIRNNVHDAMLPIEMSGTEFVTIPSMYTPLRNSGVGQSGAEIGIEDDRGDVVRFIALEDGTRMYRMRSDGTGLAPERMLKKGESFLATTLQEATYWKSDKPVIATQYGKAYAKVLPPAFLPFDRKNNETPQGHPTVESGMPMMEYVPSVDRWTNYGVFHSPEGMDNFLNIVITYTEIGKIKVDGRTLTSAFGGAVRPLQGTPYAFIRTPIGAGDHYIESVDPKVRWCAWNYGSLDGLQQGRAYGTPVSVDLSIPCDDSLDIEYQIVCGDVDGKVKLLPENSTCAQFFAFIVEEENNFVLEADVDNLTEYKAFPFKLNVIDKKLPAFARIRVITRSGNWIEKEFRYDGIDLEFNPKEVNFGTHPIGAKICSTVVVVNKQQTPITLTDLKFSKPNFTVTPNTVTLGPNESKEVQVCGTALSEATSRDTLLANINCVDLKFLPVSIKGDEPLFYASDQNWGVIPSMDKQTKQVELLNAGQSDIIVTEYQPRGDVHFTNSTLIKSLPLTLKPGQRFKYDVDYSPNGEVGVTHKLRIDYTTNATKEKLYSELVGGGSDAQLSVSPFSWTERVIDKYQESKGITRYAGKVTIQNLGNTVSYIEKIVLVGSDAGYFSFTEPVDLRNGMTSNDKKIIDVYFTPTETDGRQSERKFSVDFVVDYRVATDVRQSKSTLEGIALQPMVEITDQDWKSQVVNSVTTLPIIISNRNTKAFAPLTNNEGGTMDLLVDSLVIVGNEPFVWSNTGTKTIRFNPALRVSGLTNEPVFVDFKPTQPGVFRTQYRLYGNVLDTNFATLQGETPGENKVEPVHMITWIGTTTNGTVVGNAAYSTILTFKEFRGGDYLLFNPAQGQSLQPFQVDPTVPFTFNVEFAPDKVTKAGLKAGQNLNGRLPYQDNKFSTQIVFEDLNKNELVGDVTGDGKYLETTLRIVGDKGIEIGKAAKASFFLEPRPESIDSGNVESARLRITYDNNIITPELINQTNFPTATLIDEKTSSGMVEIDLVTTPQVDGFLGTKEFQTLLYSKSVSTVDGLYYTINKADKVASSYVVINVIPDEIAVVPVCANVRRVIDIGSPYGIVVKNNIVEVSVGIDAPLTLTSVNEIGQQEIMFSGFVKKGTYHFSVQKRGLQWIVARQAGWMDTMGIFVD
jgi:hypothetical protein